jgi:hypothetical protein
MPRRQPESIAMKASNAQTPINFAMISNLDFIHSRRIAHGVS